MNLLNIPLDKIVQKDNVRTDITKESLKSLIESIKDKGVLQPILVSESKGKYEIIAGHRRYNSAIYAGLKEIPALITKIEESERIEYQITENLQRIDLNPIDEALAYKSLGENFKPEDIVVITGKSLYRIKKVLALFNLSDELQKMVKNKELSESHAFIISKLKSAKAQKSLALEVKRKKFSPEETERQLEDYSSNLSVAKFDKKECDTCSFNGTKMQDLFDKDDVKGKCLNTQCFNKKLSEHKKALKEKIISSMSHKKDHVVILIDKEPKYGTKEYEQIKDLISFSSWEGKEFSKEIFKNECTTTCPTFMHFINEQGEVSTVCGNRSCFQRNLKRSKTTKEKAEQIKEGKKSGKEVSVEEIEAKRKAEFEIKRKESRVDMFKRKFYLSHLEKNISNIQVMRLAIDKLFHVENGNQKTISQYMGLSKEQDNYLIRDQIAALEVMKEDKLFEILKKIIIGRLTEYSTNNIQAFGEEVNIDISKQFEITDEYLNKFSKQGLIKLCKEIKVNTDLAFPKKKKTEMIEIMKKLGLKGKVPKEMLK